MNDYKLGYSQQVIQTSEQGDKLALKSNVRFQSDETSRNIIEVKPDQLKQSLHGVGASFTEASAFVLAHLESAQCTEVMKKVFSEEGANFPIARTHIASCDFCVEGHYSYAELPEDVELQQFTIEPDYDGFNIKDYPAVRDESFDLLPMIKQAQAIKAEQDDAQLNIVASAWTAPPWMKDNGSYHERSTPENGFNGSGGVLKPEYESAYAEYLIKYLEAYKAEGVDIWGLTPVNEPGGNNGNWESMHFTPESQNSFIKNHLGPKLKASEHSDINLMIFDHNTGDLESWADEIIADPETSQYVYGSAVHWYESTNKVLEEVFDKVHEKYPDYPIIHTEGCIDDLGNDAPPGVLDPVRYKESGWFDNDDFWWNENATDWGYSAEWDSVVMEDHPIYAPVHRYARHIITGMNHWLSGWIDWNIVLDKRGGPNHVGNFCGAPIMIDTESSYVYYTPVFSILSQFSRTIRPGDVVVETSLDIEPDLKDVLISSASMSPQRKLSVQVFNSGKAPLDYALKIGKQAAEVTIPANALQTLVIQLQKIIVAYFAEFNGSCLQLNSSKIRF